MFMSRYKSEPGVVEFSVFRSSAYYQYCCFCPWSVVKTDNTPTFLKKIRQLYIFLSVLGCTRYLLTQHRVNLRVLAEDHYTNTQTVHDGKRMERAASPFCRSCHTANIILWHLCVYMSLAFQLFLVRGRHRILRASDSQTLCNAFLFQQQA